MKKPMAAFALGVFAIISLSPASRAEEIIRFAPLKPEELTPAQKAWAEELAAPPRNGKITNPPFRAYIRSPDLAPKLTALADYLRWHSSLPPRLSELAILITAREWTAQYEWYAHKKLALEAGVSPAVCDAIARRERPALPNGKAELVYEYATTMHTQRTVPQALHDRAVAALFQVDDCFGRSGVVHSSGLSTGRPQRSSVFATMPEAEGPRWWAGSVHLADRGRRPVDGLFVALHFFGIAR